MNRMLADCWEILLRSDPTLLDHPLRPLDHVEPCIRYFGLPPRGADGEARLPLETPAGTPRDPAGRAPAAISDAWEATTAATPSFKALDDAILLSLRQSLGDPDKLPTLDVWAEKLLRFVELRRRSLRSRALRKCGSPAAARLHVLHLACFLMDYAIFSHDLRFLNTVLKLADMGWVLRQSTLTKHLQARDDRFLEALFQFRLLLMTECAVARLSEEGHR